jgi:hypothetical protein
MAMTNQSKKRRKRSRTPGNVGRFRILIEVSADALDVDIGCGGRGRITEAESGPSGTTATVPAKLALAVGQTHAERGVSSPNCDEAYDQSDRDRQRAAQSYLRASEVLKHVPEIEPFRDAGGNVFASFTVGHHRETWPLDSAPMREHLSRQCRLQNGHPPAAADVDKAIARLTSDAGAAPVYQTHVRLALHEGSVFLDLCNDRWEAVRITPDGWGVTKDVPVKFVRHSGMLALPEPAPGGSIDELRPLVNLPDDDDWVMATSWLLGALNPDGPHPVLVVTGEHGSAKTTLCRLLRTVIDPNHAPLRSTPKDRRDFMIAANHSWVLGFDNQSTLKDWLSDQLCQLATGASYTTRRLFRDHDEIFLTAQRPVIINGITDFADRPDLRDRAIFLNLPHIEEAKRRTDKDVRREFRAIHPGVLGALVDAVSTGLRNHENTVVDDLPRMADFAGFVVAAESGMPWEAGRFLEAYRNNTMAAVTADLYGNAVYCAIEAVLQAGNGKWRGTVAQFLAALGKHAPSAVRKLKGWPHNPRSLFDWLRRTAPQIRTAADIPITLPRTVAGELRMGRTRIAVDEA